MLTTILIVCGVFSIIDANSYKDERSEVIARVSLGIVINSIAVINYIFYIKRNLKDLNPEIRAEVKKQTMKIGEILQLIFFIIFFINPIIRIPEFIGLYNNKLEFIIEFAKSVFISIIALFLLYKLNPIDVNNKIKSRLTSKKIILTPIIILIVSFIIFRIYNVFVVIKFSNSICDYQYVKITEKDEVDEKIKIIDEFAKTSHLYSNKTTYYNNPEKTNYLYIDLSATNVNYNTYEFSGNNIEIYKSDISKVTDMNEIIRVYDFAEFSENISNKKYVELIKNCFWCPITYISEYNGIKCNVIDYYNLKIYINKETGLELAIENYDDTGNVIHTREYEYSNNIPEELSKLPDINKFQNVENIDLTSQSIDNLSEPEILNKGEN